MKSEFDKLYQLLMEDGEVAAPAGGMSTGPIISASVNEPGTDTKDGVYTPCKRRNNKRRFNIQRRKRIKTL